MKERLAIIGSSDLGQLIAWHARNDNHYDMVVFFDDYNIEKSGLWVGNPARFVR